MMFTYSNKFKNHNNVQYNIEQLNNGSQQWSRDVTHVSTFAPLISTKVQFNNLLMFTYIFKKIKKNLQIRQS